MLDFSSLFLLWKHKQWTMKPVNLIEDTWDDPANQPLDGRLKRGYRLTFCTFLAAAGWIIYFPHEGEQFVYFTAFSTKVIYSTKN